MRRPTPREVWIGLLVWTIGLVLLTAAEYFGYL